MALGTFGSTLSDELNRLANGGTYRDMNQMVDEALAAKQWANRENITPYSTDTVGVLNEIAGLGTNRQNWLDFNGVCNYIAGTSGLPAAAALRQIYPTTDLLTGVASYYVDAAVGTNYIPTTASGYLYLPGVTGNLATAPDSAALDVTGDLDIRVKVAPNNWIPSAAQNFVTKWIATGNQRAYLLGLATDGTIQFQWSTNGTGSLTRFSDVPLLLDGSTKWIRATLDVDNGASGHTVTFFTSDNGTSWTQLGSAQVNAGTTSVFASTAPLEIGTFNGGTSPYAGRFFRAQILNGIGGTTVFDANFETAMTSQTVASFTESSANAATVTVTRTTLDFPLNFINNLGAAGSLLPTTVGSSTAADSNDAKFLDHTGTNYVYLPGGTSVLNTLTTPDASALDIVGDIDLRIQVALDNYASGVPQSLISKWTGAGIRSYYWYVDASGFMVLVTSVDGTATTTTATASVVTGITSGTSKWLRVTRNATTGNVQFFTSDNGTTWTQLGTTRTTAASNMFNSTAVVGIGTVDTNGNLMVGKLFRAQILNGIDGTTVLDVDTSVITAGSATSFTAVTGQTVTINRSTSGRKSVAVTQPTWLFGTDDYMEVNNRYMAHSTAAENYVYLSGASGNYMSVADNPPLDVTGDIDIQVQVALDDWTPATSMNFISKRNTSIAYQFFVNSSTGLLGLGFATDGVSLQLISSTVAPTVADGATLWVRVTRSASTGVIKFFTSTNGTTWTQLGADVTGITGDIFSSADPVEIGSRSAGTATIAKGKFFRTIIKNGIDGTVVLDADASVITLPSQTTFVDRSSNAYTVTINKSGVGTFVSTGNYMYLPGIASNYAAAPDAAALDITGDIDLRVKVAMDDWTPSSNQSLICKSSGSSNISYRFFLRSDGLLQLNWSADGTAAGIAGIASTAVTGVTDGATKWVRVTFDVDNGAAGKTATFFTSDDGITWTQLGTAVTTAGTTSIFSGNASQEIGSRDSGTGEIARGKFFRAQVLNGIGGTVAFDANFENSITSLNQASFTESSTNGATVTINRSGSTFRSAGVIDAGYLYPGATNTFANSTTDFLNFGATDSFTVLTVVRQWASPVAFRRFIEKSGGTGTGFYTLQNVNTTTGLYGFIGDPVNTADRNNLSQTVLGSICSIGLLINRNAQTFSTFSNSSISATTSTSSIGSMSNIGPLRIGTASTSVAGQDMEFVGAAVFRQALTATQIRQITNYFANREVYL